MINHFNIFLILKNITLIQFTLKMLIGLIWNEKNIWNYSLELIRDLLYNLVPLQTIFFNLTFYWRCLILTSILIFDYLNLSISVSNLVILRRFFFHTSNLISQLCDENQLHVKENQLLICYIWDCIIFYSTFIFKYNKSTNFL